MVIGAAHRKGRRVGICGQAPSDYPEFAEFLADLGIDSMSLNPDSVPGVAQRLAGRMPSPVPAQPAAVEQLAGLTVFPAP